MKAKVSMISQVNRFVAVETISGDYSVIELLGGEVELDEILYGDFENLGGEDLRTSSGAVLNVFIQDCNCDRQRAEALLSKR